MPIGPTLPEGVIVADESNWMTLTGRAIGYGLPMAIGAAITSGRRVLALEFDGSMMYKLQALWPWRAKVSTSPW
jgi:acetolactate synthase-1/2/3 large subunit